MSEAFKIILLEQVSSGVVQGETSNERKEEGGIKHLCFLSQEKGSDR